MKIRRKVGLILSFVGIIIGSFFYVFANVYLQQGSAREKKTILIEKGDNALVVGEKLEKASLISGKFYLAFYLWKSGALHSIVAGVYEIAPDLKIPEIAKIITGGEVAVTRIPVTFPEGWTSIDMAKRLDANGFSGSDFLALVKDPSDQLKQEYSFLSEIPKGQSLEGYLFPDTYYFAKDASGQDILNKMLKNFSTKISEQMLQDIANQNKTLYQILTMASIVEGEVKKDSDRKVVAGIFYNRLASDMTLGSDATLEYVLGTNKLQHSIDETKLDSSYNTYKNKGLPPGPVSNPGLNSIMAAIYPAQTPYNYFLTDPQTGNTIFSKTFEEHVANKTKYGL